MAARLPLVARSAAVRRMDDMLAEAGAGRGSLVALTGGAGVGKTRLAEEVAARAALRRKPAFRVNWTQGGPPSGPALRPWWTLVRDLSTDAALAPVIARSSSLTALLRGHRPAVETAGTDPSA